MGCGVGKLPVTWAVPGCSLQCFSCLGCGRGEVFQKTSSMEKAIPLKRRDTNSAKKYSLQLTNLLHAPFNYSQVGSCETKKKF